MTGWVRRNRWGLALLVPLAVAAVAASSSRVEAFWWDGGFHERTGIDDAGVAAFRGEYDDGVLRYPIEADVRLEGVERVEGITTGERPGPVELAPGTRLWRVDLGFEADPDAALSGCYVSLVDDEGTWWQAGDAALRTDASTPFSYCAPEEAPGPQATFGDASAPVKPAGTPDRPRTYSTHAYVVTPDDAKPSAVRVWWTLPGYAELPID